VKCCQCRLLKKLMREEKKAWSCATRVKEEEDENEA
jgi:hypothetical protein